jgi:hypothetical protein
MTDQEFMEILESISHGWIPEDEIDDLDAEQELNDELMREIEIGEE